MGAGKTTLGERVARRLGRRFVDLDRDLERRTAKRVPQLFGAHGEGVFRVLEAGTTVQALRDPEPAVLALGGGAITSDAIRAALRERAVTVLVEVDADEAWRRVGGSDRPLARDERRFRELFEERRPLYLASADVTARDEDDVILAAGGVHVSAGALESLSDTIRGAGRVALVADANVARLHGAAARRALGDRLASTHVLPVGERAKTVAACERLWQELALGRDGTIVALGGGCTTDAAGFVAATYVRGVDWIAVPTTLVGQVDAAIGGKTAVNLPSGKNLVGAFHWPVRTLIDPSLLRTLPARERGEGVAEVVKTGLLAGERLWELDEAEMIRRCAAYKTAVCLRDPHENGEREVLNLGHTFAHALEAGARFESVSHGRAVSLGLLAALRLSADQLGLDPSLADEVEQVLGSPPPVGVDAGAAWRALGRDKKREGGRARIVLLEALGRPVTRELADDIVRGALDALIAG